MQRVFTDTLTGMFGNLMGYAREHTKRELWERGRELAVWVDYEGADCAPFKVFLRFRKDRIILSNLLAKGDRYSDRESPTRKGRMPKIIDAAFSISNRLDIECVINLQLANYLDATGFTCVGNDQNDYFKVLDATA